MAGSKLSSNQTKNPSQLPVSVCKISKLLRSMKMSNFSELLKNACYILLNFAVNLKWLVKSMHTM